MDKKTKDELRETHHTQTRCLIFAALFLIGIGFAVYAGGVLYNAVVSDISDDDHMTDPGIAMRDLENATYTWEPDELRDMRMTGYYVVFVGLAIVVAGGGCVVALAVMNDYQDNHRMLCRQWQDETYAGEDGEQKMTYCPECGLKLSKLEDD